MNKQYHIIENAQGRFVVVNDHDEIINDANGYGFKTRTKAYAAHEYYHGKGKTASLRRQLDRIRQAAFTKWVNGEISHEEYDKIRDEIFPQIHKVGSYHWTAKQLQQEEPVQLELDFNNMIDVSNENMASVPF